MSHPNGESAEPVYTPGSAAVPAQPEAAFVPAAPAQPETAFIPAAPVSAPGYAPVSAVPGYPVSAVPYGYAPVAPAPKKSRAGIIVLSIITGLLVLAAAGMSTLYFVEHSERTAADKKVAEQAASIASNEAKIKDLETQVSATKAEVAKLTQDLAGAKSKTENVTKEKEAMAACFRAMDDYFESQNNTTKAALIAACDEAAKYY